MSYATLSSKGHALVKKKAYPRDHYHSPPTAAFAAWKKLGGIIAPTSADDSLWECRLASNKTPETGSCGGTSSLLRAGWGRRESHHRIVAEVGRKTAITVHHNGTQRFQFDLLLFGFRGNNAESPNEASQAIRSERAVLLKKSLHTQDYYLDLSARCALLLVRLPFVNTLV